MIYIVEDDASIRELEQYALQTNNFQVQGFEDGSSFWSAVRRSVPELVILDVMLPDEDGYQILSRLREDAATRQVPVIMVTAKTSEIDVVKGLDKGADDYLCKPFGIMEFISRVKAVLRRVQSAGPAPAALRFGAIERNDLSVGHRRPAGVPHHRHACADPAPETGRSGGEHPHGAQGGLQAQRPGNGGHR